MNPNNNTILPEYMDNLHTVHVLFTPNEVSARCRELQIEATEDQIIHIMQLIRIQAGKIHGMDWDVIDRIIAEFFEGTI